MNHDQLSEEIVAKMKLEDFECINNKNLGELPAYGSQISEIFSWTDIEIKRCVGNPNCNTEEQIEGQIKDLNIEFLFINANFNPKNWTNPIQYYPDTSLYQELVRGVKKVFEIELRREEATLRDDVFGQFH